MSDLLNIKLGGSKRLVKFTNIKKFILDIPNFNLSTLSQNDIQFGKVTSATLNIVEDILKIYGSWFTCKVSQFNSNRIKFKCNASITSNNTYSYFGAIPFQVGLARYSNYTCCTIFIPSGYSDNIVNFYVTYESASSWSGPGGHYKRFYLPDIPISYSEEYKLIVELDGNIAKASINGIHICDITYNTDCTILQDGYSDPYTDSINASTDNSGSEVWISKYEIHYGDGWKSEIH